MAGAGGRSRLAGGLDSLWPYRSPHARCGGRDARHKLEESLVTFERTWVLIFLLLPLGWMIFEWRRTRRITALVLKTLAFIAIILALAEPTLTVPQTKMAVAVLVDTSSSISPQEPARASDFAEALDRARGRHWVRMLLFARSIRDLSAGEQRGFHLEPTAGEAG